MTNLLPNGTFETGRLDSWVASGAKAVTTEAHTGKASACMTNGGMRANLKTVPGTQYKLTAWVRLVSESGNDWGGFHLDVSDTTGPTWKSIANSGWLLTRTHGSDWFKVVLSFKAPTTSAPIDAGYFGGGGRTIPAVSGTASLDLRRANASYTVTWYDTATGKSSSTKTLTANNAGVLVLSVSSLATDTAARITRSP